MPSKTVIVGSAVGLHARPAAIIAEAAGELDSEVFLAVPGEEPVDASSSLLIMTLGAGNGDSSRSPATTRPRSTRSPPWSRRTSTPDRCDRWSLQEALVAVRARRRGRGRRRRASQAR